MNIPFVIQLSLVVVFINVFLSQLIITMIIVKDDS